MTKFYWVKVTGLAAIATLGLALFIGGCDRYKPTPPVSIEKLSVPETILLERPDITTNQVVSLSDFVGKPVLIKFFATWCGSCNAMTPDVSKLYKTYNNKGLEIVAISLDDNPDVVQVYQKKNSIQYPIIMSDDMLDNHYQSVRAIPTLILLDRNHTIVDYVTGYQNYDDLKLMIRSVL